MLLSLEVGSKLVLKGWFTLSGGCRVTLKQLLTSSYEREENQEVFVNCETSEA